MSTSAPQPAQSPGGTAGVGQPGFVARHGLFSDEQAEAARALVRQIPDLDLRTVRFVVVDQHGVPRSRSLSAQAAIDVFANGLDFSGAIYSLDTGNNVFVPPFAPGGGFGIEEFTGFPDVVLVPDPGTFQVLPWADRTGWILCDVYFSNGQPVPLDGRHLMRRMLRELGEAGYDYLAGLEIEYYIVNLTEQPLKPEDAGFTPPAPPVSVFERGYQFLSEVRLDSVAATLEALRDGLTAIGLPPRSMEDEWGPGQMEFTFAPMAGLAAADAAVLFRSAVKQMCQRRGLLATFMCCPGLPNFFSSGWHLHESLIQRQGGQNAFASPDANLSAVGRQFVSGLLDHALPMMMFAAPTVNGYRRYRPYSFAPDRVGWALENRGVMVRVQGSPGDDSSHVENRIGEPAANPYLYMAANIAAGLDGIRRGLDTAPVEEDPYAAKAAMLPTSLDEAASALEKDEFYPQAFGKTFTDYLLMMKRAELKRYEASLADHPPTEGQPVTDWEMREYFEFF
ncbi:MAG TPA: glutamine synthetase family protein [Streptosporangiaceae bacterium]